MGLKERLEKDMKESMKARDSFKLGVLRFLLAQVKNKEIDLRKPLADEDIYKIIQTLVKQRREGIAFSEKAGRSDLVEKEKAELELLESYLPKALSDDELIAIIKEIIAELGAENKDFGKIMRNVIPKVAGRVEGSRVNEIVKKVLSA